MPSVNRRVIVNPPKSFGGASEYTRAIQDERSMLVTTNPGNPTQTPLFRLYRTPYLANFTNRYNPFTPSPWPGTGGAAPEPPFVPLDQRTLNWTYPITPTPDSPLRGPIQGSIISSDGTRILITEYTGTGRVLRSTDSGLTFSALSGGPVGNWYDICSSSDGQIILVSSYGNGVRLSIDGGVTWGAEQQVEGTKDLTGCACSADGTTFLVAVYGNSPNNYLNVGTRSGSTITWTRQTAPGNGTWREVAMSADGSVMVAGMDNGKLWTFSSGSWKAGNSTTSQWKTVACSPDGSTLLAGGNSTNLYTSTDGGTTWVSRDSNRSWTSVACSSTGIGMIASTGSAGLYTSVDRGVTWVQKVTTTGVPTPTQSSWQSVVTNDDGTKVHAFGSTVFASGVYVAP